MKMTMPAVLALAALLGAGCDQYRRVDHVLLWEGTAGCVECRVNARDLVLHTEPDIAFNRHVPYTIEVQFDDEGRKDRCAEIVVQTTWLPGLVQPGQGRCQPQAERLTLQFNATEPRLSDRPDRITIRVREFRIDGGDSVGTLFERGFDARFLPERFPQ